MGRGQLTEAIDALADENITALSDEEIGERLVDLSREKARLAAYEARLTGGFDGRGVFRHDGSRNVTVWLVRSCRMSRRLGRGRSGWEVGCG